MVDINITKSLSGVYRDVFVQVNDTTVNYGLVGVPDLIAILSELKTQVDNELSSLLGHDVNGGV